MCQLPRQRRIRFNLKQSCSKARRKAALCRARAVAGAADRVWQRRLTPCWKAIAGGCHLDRRIDELIRAAGFRLERLDTGHMPGPKPWTFMYQGSAVPEHLSV